MDSFDTNPESIKKDSKIIMNSLLDYASETTDNKNCFNNIEYGITNEQYSELTKKGMELSSSKNLDVSLENSGVIIFTQNAADREELTKEEEALDKERRELEKERSELQTKINNAGTFTRTGPSKDRIAVIDKRMAEIYTTRQDIDTKKRTIPKYPNIDYIFDKAELNKKELMQGVKTLNDLMEKTRTALTEKIKVPFDAEKKDYLNKIKESKNKIEATKRIMLKTA